MVSNPKEITRQSIIDQIERDDNLLSLPQTLYRILAELEKEDYSAESLGKIIRTDPSLTTRILSMANSSFYQRFAKTTTVNQAVSVLGVTTVKCLALSSSVFKPELIAKESGVEPRDFFTYVLSIAAAAESVAKEISFKATEEAFIVGLLNDVGVLFFLHHYPEQFRKVTGLKDEIGSLKEAELKVFGIDHGELGHLLARKWRLPENIAEAIGLHENPNSKPYVKELQAIVKLAVVMNPERYSGFEKPLEERLGQLAHYAENLSLTKEQLDAVSDRLMSGTIEVAKHLGVDIGSVEELLIKANQEIWKAYLTIEHLYKERQKLNEKLLHEEREKGTLEAKTIAMATLFHYVNNAAMAIYGRSQVMRVQNKNGDSEKLLGNLVHNLDVIDKSIQRIIAVLEEVKEISPTDQRRLSESTEAVNLDDKITERINKMSHAQKWFVEAAVEDATTSG